MTNWYKDIYPCSSCVNGPYVGSRCSKKHHTINVDGCGDCGTMVNSKWYFQKEKCPDFEREYFPDPSGS